MRVEFCSENERSENGKHRRVRHLEERERILRGFRSERKRKAQWEAESGEKITVNSVSEEERRGTKGL